MTMTAKEIIRILMGKRMEEVRNLDGKRVIDTSEDRKYAVIQRKNCITVITANPDGTLNMEHERLV